MKSTGMRFSVAEILRRWAVLMPDGELERCPFDTGTNGGKVVFDDLEAARRAGAAIGTLEGQRKQTPYPCGLWDHVWHLSSRHDGIGPEHKRANHRTRRERTPEPLTYRIQLDRPEEIA